MARLIVSSRADADINAIAAFITARDGPTRATAVVERIWKTMNNLAFMPGIGGTRRYLRGGRRAFAVRPWLIVYRPLKDGVEILRVIDGRRNVPAALAGRR